VEKIGRYEIREEIGHGGMATVYLAHDPHFNRKVAIKVLPREVMLDSRFRERFNREAQTIARLEHRSIVPVYDYGEEDGQPYIVMRYMPGGSLREYIDRKGPLSISEATRIISELAPALEKAHTMGIIHRDLKPGNIMFDENDDAYLSDFGIAKLTEATTELTGSRIIGTPAYMSPEQAKATDAIDGRSDVYALSAILFEMLTGKQPYKADTPLGLVLAHLHNPIPRIREFRADLPDSTENIIEKGLAKEREQRYQTPRELSHALETLEQIITLPQPSSEISLPQSDTELERIPEDKVTPEVQITPESMQAPTVDTLPPVEPALSQPKPQKRGWLLYAGVGLALLTMVAIIFVVLNSGILDSPTQEAVSIDRTPSQTPLPEEPSPTSQENEVIVEPQACVEIVLFPEPIIDSPTSQTNLEEIVSKFNTSQDEICLILNFAVLDDPILYPYALESMISSGSPPDIVGPMGIGMRERFKGQWLDLTPYLEAANYDLGPTQFDPALIELSKQDGHLITIPFAVFPSFLYVNLDLFDEAGLNYPPQSYAYGAPYIMPDGSIVSWNTDTLREIAMLLTVDGNGNNATSPYFNPQDIIHFGWAMQWSDLRSMLSLFGPGNLVDEQGNAYLSDEWRTGLKWYYNAWWQDSFSPNGEYTNSDLLGHSNLFNSGNIAMVHSYSYYAGCCLNNQAIRWDTAVVPAFGDRTTAKIYLNSFYILNSTEHPQEAFTVLTYLLGTAYEDILTTAYEYDKYSLPARLDLQPQYLNKYTDLFGEEINWQVMVDSIPFADNPNQEAWLPNYDESLEVINVHLNDLMGTSDLDIDSEIDTLLAELNPIFESYYESAGITPHEPPCNQAEFIQDITIPDGTQLEPGETFTKTWRLKNVGTCTWTVEYALVFDSGNNMGGSTFQRLTTKAVPPGATIDVSVDLIAPDEPGIHRGYWKLRHWDGNTFGLGEEQAIWVEIEVLATGQ
jgi:multiple sugar transport system substrate-binding protein